MAKPAVLHICLSRGWGGLEMYPIRVGKALLDQGYNVYGLCITGTPVSRGLDEAGIEAFRVSSKPELILNKLFKLNRWLEERNVNVIHCHKSGDILISALLNLQKKRKNFFTEHMGVTKPKKDPYHKWTYSHIEQVFSISDETYKRNLSALPIDSNRISRLWLGTNIPSPIESPVESSLIKKEMGLSSDIMIIGNIGRICPGKGQKELLEAFAIVAEKFPKTLLLLVGGLKVSEGSDACFVKSLQDRITELRLNERVKLTGFRKDTERMLAVMDIVCLPNHNEAFGLTAIEAMAAKKAIVGANTGALPEILGPIALLCNPLNPKDIASKIEKYLLDSKSKDRNADLAYQRAMKDFSMASHISKLERYYDN
ncbi:glycosyltransferase [Vibrio ostreicida]|uniref:Glycosyltransferase n=1 Tax=Vibrio ostreicida TaxID=526588 RepID=A0ABT8BQG6_9VIBR|nr:glycosyltransferase [Vibrio ostreicida]MDN3608495.1 glycosyltransferase [Vibrio ostreicida]